MKKFILLGLFFFTLFAKEDNLFITKKEYAKMLYQNPRGIGCHKCHGVDAKGQILVNYIYKNKNHTIKATNLTKLSKKEFFKAFYKKRDKKSIMPEYFLTKEEIDTLYFYVKNTNLK